MAPGSSDPNHSCLPGSNQEWRAETWLFAPCPWCQARPGHMAHQGHGVSGGPSAFRQVCGWSTMADPPRALCHAVHCTNLSRVPCPLPKYWVMLRARPPHDGASCPHPSRYGSHREIKSSSLHPPMPKRHLLLTLHKELVNTEVFPFLRHGRSISETSNLLQQLFGERTKGMGGLGEIFRHGAGRLRRWLQTHLLSEHPAVI